MQRDLVEERGWIARADYLECLVLAQMAPGPLAAQLAIYLGWVRGGWRGATAAAGAFILPSFCIVLALSAVYVRFGGLAWMQGAFYGIGAAVIAIIARSGCKLAKSTIATDWILWAVFGISALVTAWTESEVVLLFFLFGVANVLLRRQSAARAVAAAVMPVWLFAGVSGVANFKTAARFFWYFAAGGRIRLRRRTCDCTFSTWRSCQRVSLAHRAAVGGVSPVLSLRRHPGAMVSQIRAECSRHGVRVRSDCGGRRHSRGGARGRPEGHH
jgi:chromate transport protein ChrA